MREAEARKIAAAVHRSLRHERPMLDALVVEEFVIPVSTLLGYVVEPDRMVGFGKTNAPVGKSRLDCDKHVFLPTELRVLVDLLGANEMLEEICFTGARVRDELVWMSHTIREGRMPLVKLLLADNGISAIQGQTLVHSLQKGARQLQVIATDCHRWPPMATDGHRWPPILIATDGH
jgi:hypothetical protein